jgi:hypothetical protein
MWRLLSMLTLCGMPAVCADVCGGLPTGFPKWAPAGWQDPKDDLHPVSFQLSVKQGGPALRITVRSYGIDPDRPIQAGDIEVARCADGKRLQSLPILSDQRLDFGASFQAEDINFDGYLDFSVQTEFAAGWWSRSYWVYDPGYGLFVENELTRALRELAVSKIDVDSKKHEISTTGEVCAMCGCPGMTGDQGGNVDRYRVENNHLILIHKQEAAQTATREGFQFCTVTVSDLAGGTMRVTSVRRFDINGQLLK